MSKKGKYEVQRFTCIPVETDDNGQYQLKVDQQGNAKIHIWRTGKHTTGKYQRPGQLMLTENNLMAVIIAAEPMVFKDRHSETSLQRFLTTFVDDAVLQQGLKLLK